MKFTNGYWLYKESVTAYGAVEIRDTEIDQNGNIVRLYIAPNKIYNRGQTLGGPLLTVEFSSPCEDVIGVKAYHFKGKIEKLPKFNLLTEQVKLNFEENENNENEIIISSGNLNAIVTKNPFTVKYYYHDKYLTASATKQLAYLTTPDANYMRDRLNISVGECIYGLGERFTPFVKNGQTIDVWNEDGGTSSEQSYKNIPFCISNRGYGVFVNHPANVSYEIGSEAVSKMQFSVEGEELNYYIIGGKNLGEVVSNYTCMTGKPALPPAWSFGLWLSTSFTTDYNEETINHFIDGMLERKIPLSVFHFDCFWMKEYEWCNFEWDTTNFSDPGAMLKRIKNKGLNICVWINPYIGQKSKLFDEGMKNGYLLKDKNGDVWQWDMWQPGMGLVDFTNPGAVEWYKNCLRKLLHQGVDCFKTDFGERIPLDVVYYDGSDPKKMHNYYTQLYNKTVFELLEEYKGKRNAVLFARSATVGGQSFPVHWGGDCEATYDSMAESLRGGLSLSVCGFGFWSHDISGFENTATADLYKRWVAFGLFSTHSRLHGSSSYRVPWLFDEEAVDVLRFFTDLKHKLMPYIFANACVTAETGIPVMRPMILEYQDDMACAYLDRQYMFGKNIIVAPIFNEDGEAEIYLPKSINSDGTDAKFTHLLTGKPVTSGVFLKEKYDYFGMPLWARPNSIIVMGKNGEKVEYDYNDNVEIHLFEIEKAEAHIYDKTGVLVTTIFAEKHAGKVKIYIKGKLSATSVIIHDSKMEFPYEIELAEVNNENEQVFEI